jgi:hypothetical protein
MNVNPMRFAIAVAASLACLMLGLLIGVRAGPGHAAHIFRVETVTTTGFAPSQAANRTVTLHAPVITRTVTVPTTVTVGTTVTAAGVAVAATAGHPHPRHPAKPGHGPPSPGKHPKGPGHGNGPPPPPPGTHK